MGGDTEATPFAGPPRASGSGGIGGSGGIIGLLELVGLWCFAILQPLLQLIGRNAPFLLHHRVEGVDLAIWIGLVAAAIPLLLWLLIALVGGLAGRVAAGRLRALVLGLLSASVGLGLLRRLGDPVPPWLLIPLAISTVWLVAVLLIRGSRLRQFFALLALTVPVVVALFWMSPAVRAARQTAASETDAIAADVPMASGPFSASGAIATPTPIVLVVFDELPLVSILDAELGVDTGLCPNLAELAETSTWYRNARTVSPWTNSSIASMLIGRRADPGDPATRASHPENLLTWLEQTHEVRAFELVTAMAPPGAVEVRPRGARSERVRRLAFDSSVLAGHQLLPSALAGWLSPIGHRWGDFGSLRVVRGAGGADVEPAERPPWAFALADVRARRFERFLRSIEQSPRSERSPEDPPGATPRPAFFFAHVMLPHMPYRYLPTGMVYGGRPVYERPSSAWAENEWFAIETYQRHLLQVGFVDRLIGQLVARLEAVGLWEDSLVIVTSDHGASHWPGQDRRAPDEGEHPDDTQRVPLFVKAPGQSAGGVDDREAWTIDILPTVADTLGASVPWPFAGRSLFERPAEAVEFVPDRESLERKLELFDSAEGDLRWVRLGPFRELIGARLEDLGEGAQELRCEAELDQRSVLEDFDPGARYSPALLTGELTCRGRLPADAFVLAAVNGRVAGSGSPQQVAGGSGLFAVMTAPAFFVPGTNRVELLLAWGDPGSPRLERVPF